MGNEVSVPYEGPTEVLEDRDLPSVAKYMKSKECRKVFVMLGAGVSTAAGIPDFRSPGTGLYSNLARLNLPYPEAVFEINYFRENPIPFYTLARDLYPGHFRPTLTHTFVKLLVSHHLLDTCFTQNIDTLEREAGVPAERIVEAHGSFADQHCIVCGSAFDKAKMRAAVEKAEVVRCPRCDGLVKPDIVFFGEPLPPLFQRSLPKLREADLLLIIGTSLKVHPFASLTALVPEGCPRVLINLESAGDIGSRPDDVVVLGRCDEVVRDLARELGWEEELDREWDQTEMVVPLKKAKPEEKAKVEEKKGEEEKVTVAEKVPKVHELAAPVVPAEKAEAEEARVEAEVEAITERVKKALEISEKAESQETKGETIVAEKAAHAKSEAPSSDREKDDVEKGRGKDKL